MLRLIVPVFFAHLAWDVMASEVPVSGLKSDVEILKDKWGVSHIYAENQHDLFFAQGYNAARDRLFQFEIWRRRALGTLAEIQGPDALDHDIGARLLRYRGDLDEELNHYHDDGAEIVQAFVDGVNAYIDEVSSSPETLPVEFQLLGIRPGKWDPEVVISRHNALTGGLSNEIMLAQTVTALGAEMTGKVLPFEREPNLSPVPGIDLSLITADIMHLYRASRRPPSFKAPANADLLNPLEEVDSYGSNNWVLSGSRTASGKPIMANDPHRRTQLPSLRYLVHLHAPGWNVIGAGEPTLPGVSIGHNESGAWGLTVFRIDQEDLYVYQTNPDNPNQYRHKGSWKDMVIETTDIRVRGEDTVSAELRYTVHGPVLHADDKKHLAFGLKAAWLEQGAAPYLASLRMDQATDWQSFREACYYSGLPGENMVWADTRGNIGWQAVGFTPVRFGWDGRLPVPGDGSYEWHGLVPIKAMPHLYNPEAGWYGTANHNNVPHHYPNIFSDFYSDPARFYRLNEVLSNTSGHTISHSMRLQYDNKSMTAEQIVPYLLALPGSDANRKTLGLLSGWDYLMDRDSIAALVYDRWELAMLSALNRKIAPGKNLATRVKLLEWVFNPPRFLFGADPARMRDAMMSQALDEAVDWLETHIGPDHRNWRYGEIHVSNFRNPLQALTADKLDLAPLPRGGASNTLNANRGNDEQISGATFRIIADTADWDRSVATNAPGQSGDPASHHYADLLEGWNRGDYFPLYYSRQKIETVTTERLHLRTTQE